MTDKRPARLRSTKGIVKILVISIVIIILGGGFYFWNPYSMREMEGFEEKTDLSIPVVTDHTFNNYGKKPESKAFFEPIYDYSLSYYLHNGSIYAKLGSLINIYIRNTGINDLYVYGICIEPQWSHGKRFVEDVGYIITPSESRELGNISFPGPDEPGNHKFRIGVKFMVKNHLMRWYDCGWAFEEYAGFIVLPLFKKTNYVQYNNPKYHFDRIQPLFNDEDNAVELARELTKDLGPEFSIYKICRLYDYVSEAIEYVPDDEDEDYWSRPDETLGRQNGDCEDSAILLASMIKSIGGSARLNLVSYHMFASFYAGPERSFEDIIDAISSYYGSNNYPFPIAHYKDDHGYWIMVDPVVGNFLGDTPLRAGPVEIDRSPGFKWDIVSTDHHILVDVVT